MHAVTKGTAHDTSPAAGTLPASSPWSCQQASSETGSATCFLAVGRLSPSGLHFTAFPSGHPLHQAHRSVPHHLPYFLAEKYADSCLLANICRDSSGNCILDLHEVLAEGRKNFSSSSEELLIQQTPPCAALPAQTPHVLPLGSCHPCLCLGKRKLRL